MTKRSSLPTFYFDFSSTGRKTQSKIQLQWTTSTKGAIALERDLYITFCGYLHTMKAFTLMSYLFYT